MNNAITMFEIRDQESGSKKGCDVWVKTDLTIHNDLDQLRKALADLILQYDVISILSGETVEIDLSFIQLAISLKNEAEKLDKKVKIGLKLSESSSYLLKRSGLETQILTD